MSNYTKDTIEQEMSCYRVLGSFDQNEHIVASDISNVISCIRTDLSSKIDSTDANRLFVHKAGENDVGPITISADLSVAKGIVVGSGSLNNGYGQFINGDNCVMSSNFSHAEGSQTSSIGIASHAEGDQTYARGQKSHAEGGETSALGFASHSEGRNTIARAKYSHSEGTNSEVLSTDDYSFVWSGKYNLYSVYYKSHGPGTFSINPDGDISGFYVGGKSLYDYLKDVSDNVSSEMSNYLDKRTGGIVSNDVEISGILFALNDITTSSDIHAFRHGLVGKDVDFSTGGDEVLVVGHEHKIYGKESFVAGNEGNILGAKAFHWKAIDTTNNLIYLTHEQTKFNSSNIPSSGITEITAGNYVSQSDYKKYDIPYFGPRSESYYSDDTNASCLFKVDDQISILKDDVYSGNPPKLVQKGAVGKTLILNNVQNVPYFRKLVVEDVLSGSVLSVSGLDTIEPLYQQTHYRKNTNHTYHGNYYFVCFQDVPDISTYTDGGWEKNMTFGCAALGENNCTIGYNSFAIGKDNTTEGNYSIALGYNAKAGNNSSFAWSSGGAYNVSGEGQFGINPKGGTNGFYIGSQSLSDIISCEITSLSNELTGQIETNSNIWLSSAISGEQLQGGKLDQLNIVKFDSLDTYNLCSDILTLSDIALIDEECINAENQRIISVGNPLEDTDAVNKRYVDQQLSNTLSGISNNSFLSAFYDAVDLDGVSGVSLEQTISAVYELLKVLKK